MWQVSCILLGLSKSSWVVINFKYQEISRARSVFGRSWAQFLSGLRLFLCPTLVPCWLIQLSGTGLFLLCNWRCLFCFSFRCLYIILKPQRWRQCVWLGVHGGVYVSGFSACRYFLDVSLDHFVISLSSKLKHIRPGWPTSPRLNLWVWSDV